MAIIASLSLPHQFRRALWHKNLVLESHPETEIVIVKAYFRDRAAMVMCTIMDVPVRVLDTVLIAIKYFKWLREPNALLL